MTTENLLLTVGMFLYLFASAFFIKGKIREIKEIEAKFAINPKKEQAKKKFNKPCIDCLEF